MVAPRRASLLALSVVVVVASALTTVGPSQADEVRGSVTSASSSGSAGDGRIDGRVMRAAPPASLDDAAPARDVTSVQAETYRAPGKQKKGRYRVRRGPIFNNPNGSPAVRYRILNHILGAINNASRGSTVRVMSWNIMNRASVDSLLAAQRRGVTLRVLMDDSNLTEIPNPFFRRLRAGFTAQNKKLGIRGDEKSRAKTCKASCRGSSGQAHAKFYTFSKVGKSRDVVMQGSANLTTAMAINQWNDLYTWSDRQDIYDFTTTVFDQMWTDTPRTDQYAGITSGRDSLYFSPYIGPNFPGDPVENLLNQVSCRGAQGAAGNGKNRTIIRVAPDVMRNPRGLRAATRLKQLWDQGCDVQIAYTVLGFDSMKVLRGSGGRGPIPLRHLVQDFDRDREFDNYFHLKAISINGVVGDDRSAYWAVNGSSNLSGNATFSDENIGIINRRSVTLAYQKFISFWFKNQPPFSGPGSGGDGRRPAFLRIGPVDPYAHVDLD